MRIYSRNINILLACSLFFVGCMTFHGGMKTAETQLDKKFDKDFKDYDISPAIIKKDGTKRDFPQVTYDEVWDASIVVLMQSGIILRSDKNTGVLLCMTTPPTAYLIEKGDKPIVFIKIIDELFTYNELYQTKSVISPAVVLKGKADKPEDMLDKVEVTGNAFKLSQSEKDLMTKNLLDKLGTQIYSSKKWKYLYYKN